MKKRFGFVDPKVIVGVVVALLILGIGTFAFFITWGELKDEGINPSSTKCQAIVDPSVQQTMDIGTGAFNLVVTEQLSDGSWQTIDSADWSYSGSTVTATVTG